MKLPRRLTLLAAFVVLQGGIAHSDPPLEEVLRSVVMVTSYPENADPDQAAGTLDSVSSTRSIYRLGKDGVLSLFSEPGVAVQPVLPGLLPITKASETRRTGFRIDGSQRILTVLDTDGIESATLYVVAVNQYRPTEVKLVAYDAHTGVSLLEPVSGSSLPDDMTGVVVGDEPPVLGQPARLIRHFSGQSNAVLFGHVASAVYTPVAVNELATELDFGVPASAVGGPIVENDNVLLGIAMRDRFGSRDEALGWMLTPDLPRRLIAFADKGNTGRLPQPTIGIALRSVDQGVLVEEVLEGSPAEKAGFAVGDVIRSIQGRKVQSVHQVSYFVRSSTVGSDLAVQVERDGELIDLLPEPKDSPERIASPPSVSVLSGGRGMYLDSRLPEDLKKQIESQIKRGNFWSPVSPLGAPSSVAPPSGGGVPLPTAPKIFAVPPDVNARMMKLDSRMDEITNKLDELLRRSKGSE